MLYLAHNLPEPTIFYVAKTLYYADKKHLQDYCRFICGDQYEAMHNGAVPSKLYDIFKDVRDKRSPRYVDVNSGESFQVDKNRIVPQRESNLDLLSKTDIECLNWAIDSFGRKSFKYLSDLSHEEPDYKNANPITNEMSVYEMAMNFEHGDELVQVLLGDC